MKTLHKLGYFAIGSLTYILLVYTLSGFGNEYSHPLINEQMVEVFKKDLNYHSIPKFKNVTFHFDETLPGIDVKKGATEMSIKDWIVRGGYSADVPEIYNSFRHFYDPTEPEGNRFYKDAPPGLLGHLQKIYPYIEGIDGVEWAVAHADHEYRWLQGKVWVKEAFATTDETERNKLMGKAWRAFGETLHMLADNATPAHVRNDAHPAKWGEAENKYIGDPDTFEEYLDFLGKSDKTKFINFANQKADPALAGSFQKASTIRALAHTMATYTNSNFFSGETLYGIDRAGNRIKHTNSLKKTYPSPVIAPELWDDDYYIKNGIKLCKQAWWVEIAKNGGLKETGGEVSIDRPTVEAQAARLIPAAVEAGRNAFRLFVPEINLTINAFTKEGDIQGTVGHVKDLEYTLPIVYNGPVYILNKKYDRIATLEVKKGVFEGTLDNPNDPDLEEIRATISVGGIAFVSEPTRKIEAMINGGYISLHCDFETARVYTGKFEQSSTSITHYRMLNYLDAETAEEKNGVVTGQDYSSPNSLFRVEYNPKTFELISFNYTDSRTWAVDGWDYTISMKGGNIPAKFFTKQDYFGQFYYVWEVHGKDVTQYVQESKTHSKQKDPILKETIREEWFNKVVTADNNILTIQLRYKPK